MTVCLRRCHTVSIGFRGTSSVLTGQRAGRTIEAMRDIHPILIEMVHYWAWLLRTGAVESQETLEPNSVVLVWFSDSALRSPPASVDDWHGVMEAIECIPAAAIAPMWNDSERRGQLLAKFADLLQDEPSDEGIPGAVDVIVHLADIPPATAGMKPAFQIWLHSVLGTFLSVTTLGQDLDAQIALAPDAAVRVEGALAIDGYLTLDD